MRTSSQEPSLAASQPSPYRSERLHCTALLDRYRLPVGLVPDFRLSGMLSDRSGYFTFGGIVGYARLAKGIPQPSMTAVLREVSADMVRTGRTVMLPFDPDEDIANLRSERYETDHNPGWFQDALRRSYYLLRPALPVELRKRIQRVRTSGWKNVKFPAWPLDVSVDRLLESLLLLAVEASGLPELPFVWFWPRGYSAAVMMTHDVETLAGRDFCPQLMDINDSFGIKSSFQLVPERRYSLSPGLVDTIRARGFEPNVHDLNHDGHLFSSRRVFTERAARINAYAREFGAAGFRSAVLYRNHDWLHELDFEYDMSVPTVAHLDPQPKGCCTVMPFFMEGLLELPLTTVQDYTLFHLLDEYSTATWTVQMDMIRERHGLISFIVHPDYIIEERARRVYERLLQQLATLRAEEKIWIALPREISTWWRQRSRLQLVQRGGRWQIEGAGSEDARVAYASVSNGKLVYRFESMNTPTSVTSPDCIV